MQKRVITLIAVLAIAACKKSEEPKPAPAPAPSQPAPTPAKTSTTAAAPASAGKGGIAGVAKYEGAPPPARTIDMSKDKACSKGGKVEAKDVVTGPDGGLSHVFAYVKSGLPAGEKGPARTDKVVLDQKSCMYEPTVLGLQVGQPLEILNSDPMLHNVHAFAKGADEFNQAMPKQGMKLERKFKKAQVLVPVKCEVHPWMQAWIGVVDHGFFTVTDASGKFNFEGLPDGEYEVELVHPTLGTQTQKVAVKGAPAQVTVSFKPTKS
jgi:plastocyanin